MFFGQNKKAEQEFRQAINLNPKNPDAHNNLGRVLGKDKNSLTFQEAIQSYEEFLKLTKKSRSKKVQFLRDQAQSQIYYLKFIAQIDEDTITKYAYKDMEIRRNTTQKEYDDSNYQKIPDTNT